MKITPRIVFAAIFIACALLIGYALFLQEREALEPCPMCILQRYAVIAIGLVAVAGGGVSIRHSYLQHFPPLMESCGTDLEFLLGTFPLAQALPKIFAGTGSCSKVDWTFLGLSIPEWTLVWFLIFAATALWIAFLRKPPK